MAFPGIPAALRTDFPGAVESPLALTLAGLALTACTFLYMRIVVVARKQRLLRDEKNRYKKLLLSIFPKQVAAELLEKGHVEAKRHNEVSILFTDFAGFTAYSEKMKPMKLVKELDEIFSMFDSIILHQRVEKIKTIGDSYMCATGLPEPSPTHAEDLVRVALEFAEFVAIYRNIKKKEGVDFPPIRIGLHTGPVVAGVIGVSKTAYDIWGDTVNVAQRMELASEDGRVNISETLFMLVKDKFDVTPRGMVEAKGKGFMNMYFVDGERTAAPAPEVPSAEMPEGDSKPA